MRVANDGQLHLTYCLNVHPGISWPDVQRNITEHVLPLKERLSPEAPFGVGLRLAGEASKEILAGTELVEFRSFLDEHGLYVYTMNGFPYGPFHGQAVKANVHAPDWRDQERVDYTLRLIDALAVLLPDGIDGGISTNPFGYRPFIDVESDATWKLFTERMVDIAVRLHAVSQVTGKLIHLDLEPEPDGVLGDCADLIAFYETWLLPFGVPRLAERRNLEIDEARSLMLEYIRVCFDTCHVGVGYENPRSVLARFDALGIKVGKIQVSSALRLELDSNPEVRAAQAEALAPFDEPVYLHQVIQQNNDGSIVRYPDLQEALPNIADADAAEWRIHFHVPIFVEHYGAFGSTQETIRDTFEVLREDRFTNHLEIETYTWDVLPGDLKLDLDTSIAREYEWVIDVISK